MSHELPKFSDCFLKGREVQQVNLPEVQFWVDPYIPKAGKDGAIVLLHGKWGTFKTPITLNLAKAMATGQEEIFGLKVMKARVLYVSADTSKEVIIPRMQKLGVAVDDLDFMFCYPGLNILDGDAQRDEVGLQYWTFLKRVHRENSYNVVFVDSLRAVHDRDDKESTTVHAVYRALHKLFYGATVFIIHHDKKAGPPNMLPGDETFSGSQAWVNHATVGLKLSFLDQKQAHVQLEHTKSQASELVEPLKLKIRDGISAEALAEAKIHELEGFLERDFDLAGARTLADVDAGIAEHFGVSVRTARRRRTDLMLANQEVRWLLEGKFGVGA